ncbi:MAG: ribosomal protein S18-alanine N-acetyltransferase [Gammaproteobacteria bacterium]|nr:ribosomal protein S18-alanine N-acetyltransferase [Gammaproteobacteria bacterium]
MNAVLKESRSSLRPMLESDIADILQIECAAYAFPWSRNIFRGCLREDYCCRVMDVDGEIAGYAILSMGKDEAHLLNLCVDPDRHGMGLGDQLLSFVLDFARKHKAVSTFLEVRPSNEAARRFYERRGFVEVGMRTNYYPARFGREDAIIMARETV